MTNYWVITEVSEDSDCSHRWIAYPATDETLEDVKEIAGIFGKQVWVTKEVKP